MQRVLVVDVGGTHIKVLASRKTTPIKIDSGPDMTAAKMVSAVKAATVGWKYSVVTIGYPGTVVKGRPSREPHNLGGGWRRFDFARAFGCPVRVINDAAMQALGGYDGGKMLFLGLGTGLGSAMIVDGVVIPLELAHLPYRKGYTYEEYVGAAGLERLGKKRWRQHVAIVVELLRAALGTDDLVIGGGNARILRELPTGTRLGSNANAFLGGYRVWK
ncbi:MAG: ROK family protein [bacterium]